MEAFAPYFYGAILALLGWILHTLNSVQITMARVETRLDAIEKTPNKDKRK